MLYYLLIIIIIIIILVGIYLIFKYSKNKKLNNKNILFFKKNIRKIKSNISSKESIIDYDKLYHKILLELGYKGSFGEILKNKPKEISNLNKIWELHKLRNKLVHDFDNITEVVLRKKTLEYEKEINVLLR